MSKKYNAAPLSITVDNSLTRHKNARNNNNDMIIDDEIERQKKKERKAKKKEEKRKLKQELGLKLKKQLTTINHSDPLTRNPVIIKIVENYLGRSVQVFENQWQNNTLLSDEILLNTPIFWFKKHKWKHTDVRDFYSIMGLQRENLDNQLIQTYKLDSNGKVKKKKKVKKHLRRESKLKVRGKRESSLRLMRGRSLLLLDYSKLERETLEIWIKLIKSRGTSAKECPQLNHAQFNICMMDNNIKIDPDLSVTLFWTLITLYERKKQPKKSANLLSPREHTNNNNDDLKFPDTNNEEKELTDDNKAIQGQIMKERAKKIKKAFITPKHIKYVIKSIEKNVLREDLIANPATLREKIRILVIFSKIFENIQV